MPEGIEIATISTALNKKIKSHTLTNFKIGPHYISRISGFEEFNKLLPLKVINVSFKGKVIIFDLGKAYFTSQLGMSGRWGFNKNVSHTHIKLRFEETKRENFDSVNTILYYSDVRRFGMIRFYCGEKGIKELKQKMNKLAPDFLSSESITETNFIERFNKCPLRSYVGALLMNQEKICSGVGNYILSELFYRCRLHPFIKVYDVSPNIVSIIYNELKNIMNEGFKNKGNSIRDYYNIDGKKGSYQDMLQVYMKKKDPQGNKVIQEIGPHKRTIHWVPKLQKRKLRILVCGEQKVSDIIDLGIDLLINPYKNCKFEIIQTKIKKFEVTLDDRPHLILFINKEFTKISEFVERVIDFKDDSL